MKTRDHQLQIWKFYILIINGTNSNVLKSEDGPDTVTHLLQSPRDSRTQQWAQGHSWRQCKKHLWNPHLRCYVFVMFDFISFSYHQVRYREMLPAELANRIKVTSTKTGQKCCMTEMQVSSLSLPTLVICLPLIFFFIYFRQWLPASRRLTTTKLCAPTK